MLQEERFRNKIKKIYNSIILFFSLILICGLLLTLCVTNPNLFNFHIESKTTEFSTIMLDDDRIENGIHLRTGLIDGNGLMTVVNNCTNCHSAKLLTQNRMNRQRWNETIAWMQKTQNLWNLGKNQEIIVNYLVTNYPIKKRGRRQILEEIDWYHLKQ